MDNWKNMNIPNQNIPNIPSQEEIGNLNRPTLPMNLIIKSSQETEVQDWTTSS